jgi:predicted PurR-regulated permease PerM
MKFFIIVEYILFIILIFLLTTQLIPNIIIELNNLSNKIPEIENYKDEIAKNFSNYEQISQSFSEMLKNKDLFSEKNLSILQDVLSKIKNA